MRIYDREDRSEIERESLERETEALKNVDPVRLQKWIDESKRRLARMRSGEDPGLTLEEFWSDEGDD